MRKLLLISFLLLLTGITFAQPKDILVNWECDMEIEILSGRYNTTDTVAARGNFNGWGRHDLVPSVLDPNKYVSEMPDNTWEGGNDKLYILTQADYDAGSATVSRPFNDGTLSTVTNQDSDVLFQVDVTGAITDQPENACHSMK